MSSTAPNPAITAFALDNVVVPVTPPPWEYLVKPIGEYYWNKMYLDQETDALQADGWELVMQKFVKRGNELVLYTFWRRPRRETRATR